MSISWRDRGGKYNLPCISRPFKTIAVIFPLIRGRGVKPSRIRTALGWIPRLDDVEKILKSTLERERLPP